MSGREPMPDHIVRLFDLRPEPVDHLDDYEDDYEPCEDECDHTEYEIDWEGRAQCYGCSHSWWASSEQIAAQAENERQHQEWIEQQTHPWYRFKWWVSGLRGDLQWRWRRLWKPKPATLDDEIPF